MTHSSPLKSLSGYQLISHQLIEKKEYVVMLEKDGQFSVCRTQPDRGMAITPNYASPTNSVIIAPLSLKGLKDLLFWSDKPTAEQRFNELLKELGFSPARLYLVS